MPKAFRYISFSLCISFLFAGCGSSIPDPLPPGNTAPLARVTYLNGEYDTLASYRGRNLALIFWAKWCSRSRSEIKDFHEIAKQYNRLPRGTRVEFVAVNLDTAEDAEEMRQFIASNNLMSAVRHAHSGNAGDDEAALLFQVYEVPTMVLINPQGTIQLVTDDAEELNDILKTKTGGTYRVSALRDGKRKLGIIDYAECSM